jgi:hypothetical protein
MPVAGGMHFARMKTIIFGIDHLTVRFYVPQNAQNEVCYVPCCDAEEGSDT